MQQQRRSFTQYSQSVGQSSKSQSGHRIAIFVVSSLSSLPLPPPLPSSSVSIMIIDTHNEPDSKNFISKTANLPGSLGNSQALQQLAIIIATLATRKTMRVNNCGRKDKCHSLPGVSPFPFFLSEEASRSPPFTVSLPLSALCVSRVDCDLFLSNARVREAQREKEREWEKEREES